MRMSMDLIDPNRTSLPLPPALPSWARPGRPSLFLDFDGTLVDIADAPDAIEPRADLAEGLQSLSDQLDGALAIVSGRAIADIENHIGPIKIAAAGSHGADIRLADGTPVGAPATPLPEDMETALRFFAAETGLDYERKPHGGALHYRARPDQEETAKAFAYQLAKENGWIVQHGKCVAEIVAGQSDKGSAVSALMNEAPFIGTKPLFIGDDLTDEKGFVACELLEGGGVLVGDRTPTAAHYRLPDVASVHRWLSL